MNVILTILFIIVSLLNVYSQVNSEKGTTNYLIKTITKPLLMPLVGAIYISCASEIETLLILALGFGWLGDVALMIQLKVKKRDDQEDVLSPIPMMLGLIFFLFGHITYIILFAKDALALRSHIVIYTAIYMVYIIYALFMFRYLSSHGVLISATLTSISKKICKCGVAVYMIAITLMSFTALLRYLSHIETMTLLCFIGSLIFISSDSVLSIKTLGQNDKMSGRYIMGSYIIAQTLIMVSYL